MLRALRLRYSADKGWILLTEFERAGRRMDAFAMCLFASSGQAMEGFEVKVDRGDWLREIAAPAKSAPLWESVDRWWLVSSENVAKPEEVPPTWGWYVLGARGTLRKQRDATRTPAVIDRDLLCRVVIRMQSEFSLSYARRQEIEDEAREKARAAGLAAAKDEIEWKGYQRKYRDLLRQIRRFERASGLTLVSKDGQARMGWWSAEVGAAAQALRVLDGRMARDLQHGAETLREMASNYEAVAGIYSKLHDEIERKEEAARKAEEE